MSGILWFALIIPFILAGVLLIVPSFRRRTVWWELAIPLGVTVVAVAVCQWVAISSATKDKEYWGHMGYSITHQEPATYDGECSEQYACGQTCSGSGKNRSCSTKYCTRYYQCDKTSSRACYLINDRGGKQYISYGKYKELAKRWKNFKHSKKIVVYKDSGYTTRGDKYKRPGHGHKHKVYWDKSIPTAEPIVKEYTYENRLQTQTHWGRVSKEDKALYEIFEYPRNYLGTCCRTCCRRLRQKQVGFDSCDFLLGWIVS